MDKQLARVVKIESAGGERERLKFDSADEEKLEDNWRAAKLFMAKGPSATLQYLKDEPRALLYALEAQALDGSCPPALDLSMITDPSLRRKQEAWRKLNGMPTPEAKKRFLELLTVLLPEWKEWHRTHAQKSNPEEDKDEALRLLSNFSKRTGFVFQSRL